MACGPSPEHAAHPQFQAVFEQAVRKHGVPHYMTDPVRRLVLGEADPRSFQCCNSGCMPCVRDYLGAAETILVKLSDGQGGERRRRWLFF